MRYPRLAWGVQTDLEWRTGADELSHEVDVGVRYQNDVEDRYQWDDVYAQGATGVITSTTRGLPGSQDDREAETGAWAFYVQDTIRTGNWIIKPGLRYETLNLESRDYRGAVDVIETATLDMLSGGIGIVYEFNDEVQGLAGVHLGFSPPSPGLFAGIHNLLDEEYMVSRQPHGPRPGLPRSWYAGVEIEY